MNKEFTAKQKTLFSRVSKLKQNATESELKFMDRLNKHGIRYLFQKGFIKGDYYCIVDFYLPKPYGIVIEIDGEYHEDVKQIQRDKRKDQYLASRGFKVIRIKNSEVDQFDLSKINQKTK